MANEYLKRTPTSTGNRKAFTISTWVKRGSSGAVVDTIFSRYSGNDDNNFLGLYINSNDFLYVTGWSTVYVQSLALFRDTSSWCHIVLSVDTTENNAGDRMKLYVNGLLRMM